VIAGGDAERVMAIISLAAFAAIEMSARIASTSPAPTAAPLIAETTGLLQLIGCDHVARFLRAHAGVEIGDHLVRRSRSPPAEKARRRPSARPRSRSDRRR
jgi:hypothetical protein